MPFGSLLVHLGSLLVTLTLGFLTFGASRCQFSYFHAFFVENVMQNLTFWKMLPKIRIVFLVGFLKPCQQNHDLDP